MDENIKKGISYTAIGFLFTLVNINLNFGGAIVNIMPSFVGWILLLLAIGKLGTYTEGKPYLKWIAIAGIVVSAVEFALGIVMPDTKLWYVTAAMNLISVAFIFGYFESLAALALDIGSVYGDTLNILRWLHAAFYLCGAIVSVFTRGMTVNDISPATASMVLGFGILGLAIAIWTCIVLFRLRKETKMM